MLVLLSILPATETRKGTAGTLSGKGRGNALSPGKAQWAQERCCRCSAWFPPMNGSDSALIIADIHKILQELLQAALGIFRPEKLVCLAGGAETAVIVLFLARMQAIAPTAPG